MRAIHPRLLVLAVAGLFAAAVILGGIAFAVTDVKDSRLAAAAQADNMARLLQSHLEHSFSEAHLILDYMETLRESPLLASDPQEAWRELSRFARHLPLIGGMWLNDEAGNLLLTTNRFPAPDINGSENGYFRRHAAGESYIVDDPAAGGVTGRSRFTVSKRIEDADGRFRGIAVVALYLDDFDRLYASLQIPEATTALLRSDGAVLFRTPRPAQPLSAESGKILAERVKLGEGVHEFTSVFDGIRRLAAFRKLANAPVVVAATLSLDGALAPVRGRLLRLANLGAFTLLVMAAVVWMALRSLRRTDAATAGLAAANSRLNLLTAELQSANGGLGRALAAAEEAVQAKDRFLAAASHDLRQPFQAVRLFLDVLAMKLKDEAARPILERASESAAVGEDLLNSLLDLSVLRSGTVRLEASEFECCSVIDEVVSSERAAAEAKGIELRHVPCHGVVASDRLQLQRILRNLVHNAIRYTDSGGVLIGCRRRGGSLRIEVWDTGPGIPADETGRVFDEFYQLANPERDRRKGLGLGLAVVSHLGDLLGHTVQVRSKLGKGSVFSVAVPLVQGKASTPCRAVSLSA